MKNWQGQYKYVRAYVCDLLTLFDAGKHIIKI